MLHNLLAFQMYIYEKYVSWIFTLLF